MYFPFFVIFFWVRFFSVSAKQRNMEERIRMTFAPMVIIINSLSILRTNQVISMHAYVYVCVNVPCLHLGEFRYLQLLRKATERCISDCPHPLNEGLVFFHVCPLAY